jgi:hypothetical protein
MPRDQELDQLLAARPRRRHNRKVTDEECAEWAKRRKAWGEEREAKARQARLELAAALEERDKAERAVQDALLAAMELNTAEPLRELIGTSPATFWRRVAAAREAVA